MKALLLIASVLTGSYLLISWAGENPRDARNVKKQVDSAAHSAAYTVTDKGKRVVEQIKQ